MKKRPLEMCVSQNNLDLTTRTICSQLHTWETQSDKCMQSRRVWNKLQTEKEIKAVRKGYASPCLGLCLFENHLLGKSVRYDEHQEH